MRHLSKNICGLKGHIGKSTWEITDTVTSAKFWTDSPVKQRFKKETTKTPSVTASAI